MEHCELLRVSTGRTKERARPERFTSSRDPTPEAKIGVNILLVFCIHEECFWIPAADCTL